VSGAQRGAARRATDAGATRRRPLVRADVVRAAAGLSVLVVALWTGPVAAALLALVLAGTFVPRWLEAPAWLDVSYGVALLCAAWAGVLGLYEQVGWLDLAVHLVATGLAALVAQLAIVRARLVSWPTVGGTRRDRVGNVLVTTTVGAALAVAWEIAEWSGHRFLDPTIHVGYDDTISDLAAGVTGSFLAGLLAVVVARRDERLP